MSTRSAFVSAAPIAVRARVAASVWSVCASSAYGAGVRGGHHVCARDSGAVYGWKSRGSAVRSGKLAGSKSSDTGASEPEAAPAPEPKDEIFRGLRSRSGFQRSLD